MFARNPASKISGQPSRCSGYDSGDGRKHTGIYHNLCEAVQFYIYPYSKFTMGHCWLRENYQLSSNFADSFTFTIRKMPWYILLNCICHYTMNIIVAHLSPIFSPSLDFQLPG